MNCFLERNGTKSGHCIHQRRFVTSRVGRWSGERVAQPRLEWTRVTLATANGWRDRASWRLLLPHTHSYTHRSQHAHSPHQSQGPLLL